MKYMIFLLRDKKKKIVYYIGIFFKIYINESVVNFFLIFLLFVKI